MRQGRGGSGWRENRGCFTRYVRDAGRVEMLGLILRDQDEIGLRKSFVVRFAAGVDVNYLSLALDDQAGMIDWRGLDRARFSVEQVGLIDAEGDDGSREKQQSDFHVP